jgi:ketosteroid isomerase-like protein
MSQNAEVLREVYELMNAHFPKLKAGDLDALLAFFDPDVVIEVVDAPDPATYQGHDGVRRWFDEAFGVWNAVRVEAEDIRESGEWTVALLQVHLRGEASGVEVALPLAALHKFRSGRIVRDRVYLNRAEALKAVGLEA